MVIAFAINYAAYFAEIYRGGIDSMPVGQYEAAGVLGYTKLQTFMRIILPQVVKRIMPSITNEVVTLVKDTSIAFCVSYEELFTSSLRVFSTSYSTASWMWSWAASKNGWIIINKGAARNERIGNQKCKKELQ